MKDEEEKEKEGDWIGGGDVLMEGERGEGAQTFSLRGLRNLRLRACRLSERRGNDLLDPLSLSRDAAPGHLVDILDIQHCP